MVMLGIVLLLICVGLWVVGLFPNRATALIGFAFAFVALGMGVFAPW